MKKRTKGGERDTESDFIVGGFAGDERGSLGKDDVEEFFD